METINFEDHSGVVAWKGLSLDDGVEFQDFMQTNVASRLNDEEGSDNFEAHLNSLAGTGFAAKSLSEILDAEIPEERDWAVGEAMAESWLEKEHSVVWPWNMERDKRTPKASLPGADLVGFITENDRTRLVIGEVKTSSEAKYPPQVMSGRHGHMGHQLDNLATNLSLLVQVLKWLFFRCKGTQHEDKFNSAISLFLQSGNRDVYLFGILIRDVKPDENDLKARGEALAKSIPAPSSCQLIALYLPCSVSDLPAQVSGGSS